MHPPAATVALAGRFLLLLAASVPAVTAGDLPRAGDGDGDVNAAEATRLRGRVAELEAENRELRQRLERIAELSAAPSENGKVAPGPGPAELRIVVASDDWGDAVVPDVREVLYSAARPLWRAAGSPPLDTINVVSDQRGPMVIFRPAAGAQGRPYRVLLDVKDRRWAQLAYQFSHEVAHILANYRDVPNPQHWLEEAICECASLYALRQMGREWKTAPPYPNWTSYAGALTDYAVERIESAQDVPAGDLAAWYAQHRSALEASSTNRPLNLVVAVKLLPIFERHPDSWKAMRALNRGDPAADNATLEAYLAGWHRRADEPQRPAVREVAALFGIAAAEDTQR